MNKDHIAGSVLAFILVLSSPVQAHEAHAESSPTLDIKAIEQAIGKPGEMKDDVYKISLPRKDLSVSVKGVQLKPGFALGSWIAFRQAGKKAIVDGDLVLTEEEVGPVFGKLRKEGIEVSALHNHLIGETPRVMFLHIEGQGDAREVAMHLKEALNVTATPIGPAPKVVGTAMTNDSEEADFDAELIQKELGHKGNIKNGVLQISVPRNESIKMGGVPLPPSMGMATSFNFQSSGEHKVAATGDFVMVRDDVDRVTKALTEHGILITALHNHLVHGSPDLYFMHFWAADSPEKVSKGLRAGLDVMKRG
ncbi:MAG TPA: DUF1259 domain-containing protein [Nitrospiraceae bacterium]|nr:DUF1259 domain-containing protein [Nitrospiraceae bacterium]